MKGLARVVRAVVARIDLIEQFLLAVLFVAPLVLASLLVVLTILLVRP